MKRVIGIISGIFLSFIVIMPVFATPCISVSDNDECAQFLKERQEIIDRDPFIITSRIINTLAFYATLILPIFMIYGVIKWISAKGDKAKVKFAKKIIIITATVLVFIYIIAFLSGLFGLGMEPLDL
jgi:hypothetical protein